MPLSLVKKRSFFHVIGYEPLAPARIYRRFARELEHLRRTWNVRAEMSPPPAPDSGPGAASWRIETSGPNWAVETEVVMLDWSDFVAADFAAPRWRALPHGLAALGDFLLAGAAAGYWRTNWRYLLFFVYPLALLALFAAGALLVGRLPAGLGWPWPHVTGILAGLATFLALVGLLARPLYLDYMLRDWSFAADVVRGRRPELDVRLDALARAFAAHVRACGADEVVIASYSFGAVMMMEIVARALRLDPALARRGPPIRLLSAGSSLLKIGLHPAAASLRAAVKAVVEDPALFWVEYQALADPINFYRTDPVAEMGLGDRGKPIVRLVSIRNMLSAESYRRMRGRFFRVHLQFALGNERRYDYDFLMICCGPMPLDVRALTPGEAVSAFAADGAYAGADAAACDAGPRR